MFAWRPEMMLLLLVTGNIIMCVLGSPGNLTLQTRDTNKTNNSLLWEEASDPVQSFAMSEGIQINITDDTQMVVLSSAPAHVSEGDRVTLRCTSAFSFLQPEVLWYRDGYLLGESGPALKLGPLTASDSGNYTCALARNRTTMSPPFSLNVDAHQSSPHNLDGLRYTLSDTVKKVAAAIVHVRFTYWGYHEYSPGFIVSEDGLVVVDNFWFSEKRLVKNLQVNLTSGAMFDGEIKDLDLTHGHAVIKINTTTKLPFVRLGDSADLQLGETLLAMNKWNWNVTLFGTIKELDGRHIEMEEISGCGTPDGPLVTLDGQVVGFIRGDATSLTTNFIRESLDKIKGWCSLHTGVNMRMNICVVLSRDKRQRSTSAPG
ncbi:serine protease HTRA1B-like isoform X1 [Dunckerocampus dactyliophorus]|uniref:serine protease HTRA1B-like isoform X1 n=1 Tax=Dunckerocampus dactyliophorus TaxID=161453 RepID=UPI002406FF9F|nr:serine protease HTRA1B-like isoform X1 [Dunckerocampus dactyliophorus]